MRYVCIIAHILHIYAAAKQLQSHGLQHVFNARLARTHDCKVPTPENKVTNKASNCQAFSWPELVRGYIIAVESSTDCDAIECLPRRKVLLNSCHELTDGRANADSSRQQVDNGRHLARGCDTVHLSDPARSFPLGGFPVNISVHVIWFVSRLCGRAYSVKVEAKSTL